MYSHCPELCAVALAATLLAACNRATEPQTAGPAPEVAGNVQMPSIQPGMARAPPEVKIPFAGDAQAIVDGERLYGQFGCAGCHAGGGGGMGPPLIDEQWIYGSAPANIFATIIEGRPQGMPSFRAHLSTEDAWRLVSYVRALARIEGALPKGLESTSLQAYATENLEGAPKDLQDYYRDALGQR